MSNAPTPQLQAEVIDGLPTIEEMGHRDFVGGMWDEIGRLQFEFLVKNGLKPEHCFLDIACGCLRGGIHFINYLQPTNYLGIDKEQILIDRGIREELGDARNREKQPEFVISRTFEFERFSKKPDFSLAQSLFTHLTSSDIENCLQKLRAFVNPGHTCFATFFVGECEMNPEESNSRQCFWFTVEQMERFGEKHSWTPTFIGDWQHPRDQQMMQYVAK